MYDEYFGTDLLGTCVNEINNFTCNCEAGYTGLRCDVNIDDCYLSPCGNGR